MPTDEGELPPAVRSWFEARHPGGRLEFHDVRSLPASDPASFGARRAFGGWFTIDPPERSHPGDSRVRFFRAFVSRLDGQVVDASEHRPTPVS